MLRSLIVLIFALFLELRLPTAAGARPLGKAEGFAGALGKRCRGDRAGAGMQRKGWGPGQQVRLI